jgi:aconitate hydratase
VRSFARIHETNLKKQGLLPLTFADTTDWERIEPLDRVSIVGLSALAPGKPVQVVIHKPEGREITILAQHTFTQKQIGWFQAGSALNALR